MLYLITGDNKPEISDFISKTKSNSSGITFHEFTKDSKYTLQDIVDLTNSTGMFSEQKIILLYASKAEQIEFADDFLKSISTDKENHLYVIDDGISKLSGAYKKLKKASNFKEFALPRDYSGFNLTDAIFIENNKNKAIESIHSMQNIEVEGPMISALLYMGLRNYVSVKQNNNTASKLHPFVAKKNLQSKYNPKSIPEVYLKLLELDHNLKSNSLSKRDLIDDFVLYSDR